MAAGNQVSKPTQIPDSAFHAVVLPTIDPSGMLSAPSQSGVIADATDVPVLADPWLPTPPPERAQPSIKPPTPVVKVVPTPTPPSTSGGSTSSGGASTAVKTSRSISGRASWYCRAGWSPCTVNHPDVGGVQAYAAAGPRLRAAIGPSWRGHIVYVDGMRVKLIDWCQCYKGESNEKLLDLYYDVFARVGSRVTVRW